MSGGVPVPGTLPELRIFDPHFSAGLLCQTGTSPALRPPKCTKGGKCTSGDVPGTGTPPERPPMIEISAP